MDSFDILVIILSATLGLLLILCIVIAIKLIQLINYIKKISEHAEKLASQIETAGEVLSNNAKSIAFAKLFGSAVEGFMNRSNKRRK